MTLAHTRFESPKRGFSSREAQQLLRGLRGLPIAGCDLVEVSPPFDGPGQVTSLLAANLLFEMLCVIAAGAGVTP
jgi:arginase family enzyme